MEGTRKFRGSAKRSRETPADADVRLCQESRRRLIRGYTVTGIVGSGTISTVYLAKRDEDEKRVALKILHANLARDPEFVQAYLNESNAIARFHHQNIVRAFDSGVSNGLYYHAHEYLAGGSMADLIRDGKAAFSENTILIFLRQAATALCHAWEAGVYHGDINPGNLMLNKKGDIKIANLGVPRVALLNFTRSGPDYAAPEQLDDPGLVNVKTDIYSLGATFFHISFGVPPFPGDSPAAVLAGRRANAEPAFPPEAEKKFSAKYLDLIRDLMATDAAGRPIDARSLADRLERLRLVESGNMTSSMRPNPIRRPAGSAADSSLLPPVVGGSKRRFSLALRRPGRPAGRSRIHTAAAVAIPLLILLGGWFLARG
ncbi:MAG: serine/threonine protein kinase [Planctomycetota bacterium]|jgi:serine/threonine-protein kinase|nr:serine/threonine protein kinase [Planctomycetota bacterium]